MSAAIEIREVARRFGRVRAVDGVSLAVPAGGVMGIVGESGCGKSTLARIVLGLLPPDAGSVLVGGRRLHDLDRLARARLIQPVFQDPYSSLNPRQHVRDIVALPLRAQGERDVGGRVEDMLGRVGLGPAMADRLPRELSGGQRQPPTSRPDAASTPAARSPSSAAAPKARPACGPAAGWPSACSRRTDRVHSARRSIGIRGNHARAVLCRRDVDADSQASWRRG